MSTIYSEKEHKWRDRTVKVMLTLLSTAIIVWFLPRNDKQPYKYEVNKPWTYGAFIAQFEFPIYKSDEAIKRERDSLMTTFQAYYNKDDQVEAAQIRNFNSRYPNGIPGASSAQNYYLMKRLHEFYQIGIIDNKTYDTMSRDTTKCVRIVDGQNATSEPVHGKMSPNKASDMLMSDPQLQSCAKGLEQMRIIDFIVPNIVYDSDRTQMEQDDLMASVAEASGKVMSGQKVIDRGEIVDEYTYSVLSSFDRERLRRTTSEKEFLTTLLGQILFVFLLVVLYTAYLQLYRKDYFEKPRAIIMLYFLLTVFPVVVSLIMNHNFFSVYIIPLSMAPMFIRVFMDSRTAFLTHAIIVMICAAAVKYQYEFILIQLCAGLTAIYTLRELSTRSQVFSAAITVTLVELCIYGTLQLMQDTDNIMTDMTMVYHFIFSGVLLLLTYPLMFLVEKIFGFVSTVTLFELSDTNRDLLRKLSEVAPGTFQHSVTVGNLASNIAKRIGAKALLVRTGAMYHDIGKMENPVFFTENQMGINPHQKLDETESAKIIIEHVSKGIEMAEAAGLPDSIVNFIRTHHGNGMSRYFYIQYKNKHPEAEIDESVFSYPGPNPSTKEQAILMMADTTEAASRSLPEYTQESITTLVNRLIDGQQQQGFFRDCPITYRDISIAKEVLIESLMSIYHTRIAYPELKK